ncbi:serum response factor [Nematostella vectensis]|nr:serum response factor [Nematostella vectensis]
MQTEPASTSDALENMQYSTPSQVVLEGAGISEQSESFLSSEMAGDSMKRPLESDEDDDDGASPVSDQKPKKKTRGRVKIEMKFISNKLRRYTTFSKRKTGIMKKAYELSTLTGTQVMLLVASETGHVYTFATRKLQPMITSESGKALIQTCLNSPDPPVSQIPNPDQRMSATGYEETDLTYTVSENETDKDRGGMFTAQQIETGQQIGGINNATMTGITAMSASGHTFPITTYIPHQGNSKPGQQSSYSVQAMPGGGAFTTIFTPGSNLGGTPIQLAQNLSGQHGVQMLAQLQRGQTQTTTSQTNVGTTGQPSTVQVQIGTDGQMHTQESVEHSSTSQATTMQSLGALMVPIATHQGEGHVVSLANVVPSSMMLTTQSGQIPVMYYTGPVSNINDNEHQGTQHDSGEVSQQAIQSGLSLSTVHVQHDMAQGYHSVVTEASGSQAADEVHNIVSEASIGSTNGGSPMKGDVPDADNHTEV